MTERTQRQGEINAADARTLALTLPADLTHAQKVERIAAVLIRPTPWESCNARMRAPLRDEAQRILAATPTGGAR